MDAKQEILDIPRALEETLENGRAEYEAVVRRTRWGEGPIYVVGQGASFLVGLTAVYAFEGLLGWPVVARPAAAFAAYVAAVLRPHSILLAVEDSGESEATLDAARAARSRGAVILALTSNPAGPLAQMAEGVFLVRAGEESGAGIKARVAARAAVGYLGLVAARVLKRHHPQLDVLEQEFAKLPRHVEWVVSQLPDAVRSLASELKGSARLYLAGAGFYHPAALEAARLMAELAGLEAQGFELCEFAGPWPALDRDTAVVFLSGSRCRLKKEVHAVAARVQGAGAKVISVTDSNDRELADRSRLAVLLPGLTEMVGSTLALALLAWGARETRQAARDPNPSGAKR